MFRHCIVTSSSVLRRPVIWLLKMRSLCCVEMLDDGNPEMGRIITEERRSKIESLVSGIGKLQAGVVECRDQYLDSFSYSVTDMSV
jgi:hypothetical protein